MATHVRPRYINLPQGHRPPTGYDMEQEKHDGMYVRIVNSNRRASVYNRNGRLVSEIDTSTDTECVLIAEHMVRTQRSKSSPLRGCFVVHDALAWDGDDLTEKSQSRRLWFSGRCGILGPQFVPVETHRSGDGLWFDVRKRKGEGIVHKRSDGKWGCPVYRQKPLETWDLYAAGISDDGKSVMFSSPDAGVATKVYSGFSRSEIAAIAADPGAYAGRVAIIEGAELTAAGNIRHARFLDWHAEK